MTLLLTAFDAFAGVAVNPSQLVIEALALRNPSDLVAAVLPTAFGASGNRMRQLIRDSRPRSVVCLGVKSQSSAIQLERFALNLDYSDSPDNDGQVLKADVINPRGPAAYHSTLPLELFAARLRAMQIPVAFSDFAGTYVCNHVFYIACEEARQFTPEPRCGLIHVPMVPASGTGLGMRNVDLPLMVSAIENCIQILNGV